VSKGECVGLIGGSGVGKSVILRSLIVWKSLTKVNFIDGEDIVPLNEHQLVRIRGKVAYVFSNGALFDSLKRFR